MPARISHDRLESFPQRDWKDVAARMHAPTRHAIGRFDSKWLHANRSEPLLANAEGDDLLAQPAPSTQATPAPE
jgi:hypothetical protein